jgi:hypothetical protein
MMLQQESEQQWAQRRSVGSQHMCFKLGLQAQDEQLNAQWLHISCKAEKRLTSWAFMFAWHAASLLSAAQYYASTTMCGSNMSALQLPASPGAEEVPYRSHDNMNSLSNMQTSSLLSCCVLCR